MWYFRDIQESLLVPLFNICCDTTSKQSRLRGESTQKQKQACDRRRCNNKSLVTDCVGVLSQLYVSVHRLFVVLNVVIKCWYCRLHCADVHAADRSEDDPSLISDVLIKHRRVAF